jgi:hypothetical protein
VPLVGRPPVRRRQLDRDLSDAQPSKAGIRPAGRPRHGSVSYATVGSPERARRRRAMARSTVRSIVGSVSSTDWNARSLMTKKRRGVTAVTVAVRVTRSMRAISPKNSPALTVAIRLPSQLTSAEPSTMTKNWRDRRPRPFCAAAGGCRRPRPSRASPPRPARLRGTPAPRRCVPVAGARARPAAAAGSARR